MQQWVRDQNVKLFSGKLAGVLPPEQRAVIEALLAKELAGEGVEHMPAASAACASAAKRDA